MSVIPVDGFEGWFIFIGGFLGFLDLLTLLGLLSLLLVLVEVGCPVGHGAHCADGGYGACGKMPASTFLVAVDWGALSARGERLG